MNWVLYGAGCGTGLNLGPGHSLAVSGMFQACELAAETRCDPRDTGRNTLFKDPKPNDPGGHGKVFPCRN